MPQQSVILATKERRQYLVAFALRLTKGTRLEPSIYEQDLLEQFVQGKLTIEQVEACLTKE